MESSYKKLSKLKDETKYRLWWLKENLTRDAENLPEEQAAGVKYALIKMKDLLKLYEIE